MLVSLAYQVAVSYQNAQLHEVAIHDKLPNDTYVGDLKIAGTLIEHTLSGPRIIRSIIGIGLNINALRRVNRGCRANGYGAAFYIGSLTFIAHHEL